MPRAKKQKMMNYEKFIDNILMRSASADCHDCPARANCEALKSGKTEHKAKYRSLCEQTIFEWAYEEALD